MKGAAMNSTVGRAGMLLAALAIALLFVDDFLVEKTTLKRTFHRPEYHANNPVLKPDKPWEMTNRKLFT